MRRAAVAIAVILAVIVVAGVAIRWFGAPRAVANSVVGAPFVRVFNDVRARIYFARDDACLRDLAASGLPFRFVAAPPTQDACPLRNAVRVLPSGVISRPLYMTCRLARALQRFDQTIVQPAAERHFGQPVVRLDERGVRNCRPVDGYDALLSEHAFANGIDVAGFVLRDGTVVNVTAGGGTDAGGAFIREVTARACNVFRTVLGPGFDASHESHLHLDMGVLGGCRP